MMATPDTVVQGCDDSHLTVANYRVEVGEKNEVLARGKVDA
jgi:hypothetical protein